MKVQLAPGEFVGTMGELERKQRKYRGQISWLRTFKGTTMTELYVDGAGTIYGLSPETGKFTRIVGQAIPLEKKR